MDWMSDWFTYTVEYSESAISTILKINRFLVSTFYGSLWLVATWLVSIFEGIFLFLLTIVDLGYHSLCMLYWCAENILVTMTHAILRLDFISQIVPDTIAAMIYPMYDGLCYFLRYCYSLSINIILGLVFPVKLMLSTLEYFGRELRQSAVEVHAGAVSFAWWCKDLPREIYAWISLENIKSFIFGLPFIWSIDFYLSIVVLVLSYFFLRKTVRFMRQRNLTCWPIYFAAQLRSFGYYVRRKMERRMVQEEKSDVWSADRGELVLPLAICDGSNMCIICVERSRDTLLLPCRHLCLCSICWDVLEAESNEQNRSCPLCRTHVTAFVSDVFLS